MPASLRTQTAIDQPAQPEQTRKTRGSKKKGSEVDSVPSKPAEGEILPATPVPVPEAPKKRGRKPKQATAVEDDPPAAPVPVAPKKRGPKPKQAAAVEDDSPPQKDAGQPAGNTVNSKGAAIPGPTRDPLPLRGGRNTHPARRDGVQPTPRRSSQEVAADREHKRQELEDMLRAAEEAKCMLAQMVLEDERVVEGIDEECRQRLGHHPRRHEKTLTIVESDHEEFQGLDEISEDSEDELEDESKDEDEDTGKAKVSPHQTRVLIASIAYQ